MGNWHASLPLVSARLSEKRLHLHHRFTGRWSGAVRQAHISGSTPGVGAASEGRSFLSVCAALSDWCSMSGQQTEMLAQRKR